MSQPSKKPYYILPGLAILLLFPLFANDHLITIAVTAFIWAYLCVCWNMVFGYSGQFSLGHALFFGTGGYTSTVLYVDYGISPWFGLIAGAVLAAVMAFFISILVLRYRIKGIYFALVTLAITAVAEGVAINLDVLRGPSGILLPLKSSPADMLFLKRYPYYYVILGFLVLGIYVSYLIKKRKIGYYLIAIREDEAAAEISGVPTSRYKILIMVISAFMTGITGSFYAQFFLYIAPDVMLGFGSSLKMMMGTCVGGPGTLWGPVFGSLGITFLDELLRMLPLQGREILTIQRIVSAALLLTVILYLPGGLASLGKKLKENRAKVREDIAAAER